MSCLVRWGVRLGAEGRVQHEGPGVGMREGVRCACVNQVPRACWSGAKG